MQEKTNFKILSPQKLNERGGTFVFSTENDDQFLNYLIQNKVFVDRKSNYGIRFSPHIYNTWDEINKFTDIIEHLKIAKKLK